VVIKLLQSNGQNVIRTL